MKRTIRNLIGKLIANTLISLGFVKRAVKKLQKEDYIIPLCFHAPSKVFFESAVKWLSQNGFKFISVCDLEKIIDGEMDFPKGAVVITIDDGWQSNLDNIVPIAEKYKVPISIFVTTEVVEKGNGYWWSYIAEARKMGLSRESVEFFKTIDNEDRLRIIEETKNRITINRQALTVEQVQQIAKSNLVSIGSHTISHPILPRCSNEQSKYEIIASKEKIEEWLNKPIKHFAYPNGDFSNREISFLRRFGYTVAFSTDQKYLSKDRLKSRYTLPRLMMVDTSPFEENMCRIVGVWPLKPRIKKVVYP